MVCRCCHFVVVVVADDDDDYNNHDMAVVIVAPTVPADWRTCSATSRVFITKPKPPSLDHLRRMSDLTCLRMNLLLTTIGA